MLIRYLIIILGMLTFTARELLAQREWDTWHAGSWGIQFEDSVPSIFIPDSILDYRSEDGGGEGYACISDRSTGKLLFLTSGRTVWNRHGRRMPNGTGLLSPGSSYQPAIIVPDPGDNSRYYIFCSSGAGFANQPGYSYSIVDMRVDSGRGDVIVKNVHLADHSSEELAALRHCNGTDFWVVTRPWQGEYFELYLLSTSGVATRPVVSPTPGSLGWMSIEVSPDGSRLAATGYKSVLLFDVDNSTGVVTPTLTIPFDFYFYNAGLQFSPDNSKLYVAGDFVCGLLQYDLSTGDSASIVNSRLCLDSSRKSGPIQLGSDGRIYAAGYFLDTVLGVVNRPNEAGWACMYDSAGFDLDGRSAYMAFPNVIDAYAVNSSRCQPPRSRAIVGDTSICVGGTLRYTDSSTGADEWHWTFDGGAPATFDSRTPPPVRYATAGAFTTTLVTSNANGSDTANIRIVVHPYPVANAGSDIAICEGDSVQLIASGGTSFRWRPWTTLDCDTCASPSARPTMTTTYVVEVFNDAGCSAKDSVTVSVSSPPILVVGSDTSICVGGSATLNARGAAGYRWSPSASLSCGDCASPIARPAQTTTYVVVGASAAGCIAIDSITVTVDALPQLVLEGDSVVCPGAIARVSARGAQSFKWSSTTTRVACDTCPEQSISPSVATTLYVVGTSEAGCTAIDSFTVRIARSGMMSVSERMQICRGSSVVLHASGAASYEWSPSGDLSCADCADPIASPQASTQYTVIGRSSGGCADTATVQIDVANPIVVNARLERGVRVPPGDTATVAAHSDVEFVSDSVGIDLSWHQGLMRVEEMRPSAALIRGGWKLQIIRHESDRLTAVLSNDAMSTVAPGRLFEIIVRGYIGDSSQSEITMNCIASINSCSRMVNTDGQVVLDSMCGLSFRLIEMSDALLKLVVAPNPISNECAISYSIPFDDVVDIWLVDARGGVAQRLMSDHVAKGEHGLMLNARDLADGIYELRMSAGGLSAQVPIVVVK